MTVELEGRELRERVARIIGWEPEHPPEILPDGSEADVVPHFDTNPVACKLVKDWLREQGISFDITWWAENEIWENDPDPYCVVSEASYGRNTLIEAPTEELAVCRFVVALDSVRGQDGDEA